MCVYVQLIIINGICVLELFNLDRFLLSFAERRFSAKGYVERLIEFHYLCENVCC